MPAIIALLRRLHWKAVITAANVASVFVMFIYLPLAVVIWLILMIMAFVGNRRIG